MMELIRQIIRQLVDHPDQVELEERVFERGVVYAVKVAPDDVGKVIGRDGRLINSLRMLMRSAPAPRRGMRYTIDIEN
jgi:predicted RNA-binding protein YlqC (UPF0109 family)